MISRQYVKDVNALLTDTTLVDPEGDKLDAEFDHYFYQDLPDNMKDEYTKNLGAGSTWSSAASWKKWSYETVTYPASFFYSKKTPDVKIKEPNIKEPDIEECFPKTKTVTLKI